MKAPECLNFLFLKNSLMSNFLFVVQALGLKRDDTFSVTMLGHCIEMYIGDTDAYIGRIHLASCSLSGFLD